MDNVKQCKDCVYLSGPVKGDRLPRLCYADYQPRRVDSWACERWQSLKDFKLALWAFLERYFTNLQPRLGDGWNPQTIETIKLYAMRTAERVQEEEYGRPQE